MAEEKHAGGGGSHAEMWHVILAILVLGGIIWYMWSKNETDPNWSMFKLVNPSPVQDLQYNK